MNIFEVGKNQDYLMEQTWCEHTRISVLVQPEGLRIGGEHEEALVEWDDVPRVIELLTKLLGEHNK